MPSPERGDVPGGVLPHQVELRLLRLRGAVVLPFLLGAPPQDLARLPGSVGVCDGLPLLRIRGLVPLTPLPLLPSCHPLSPR